MEFNEKLVQAMQELGLNQKAVSDLTGRGKSSISQYISGKQVPGKEAQIDIAVSLGLDPDYFLDKKKKTIQPRKKRDGVIPHLDTASAARLLGMSHVTVRKGLQQGVFPWGYGIQTSENHWVYFINKKRFYEIEGVG